MSPNNDPWWFSPTIFQIIATPEAIEESRLSPPLINRILKAMANKTFPTRPRRARKKWPEVVLLDGTKYLLTCCVDDNARMIEVSHISAPKTMRKKPIRIRR